MRFKKTILAATAIAGFLTFACGKVVYDNWKVFEGANWPNPWKRTQVEQRTPSDWTVVDMKLDPPEISNHNEIKLHETPDFDVVVQKYKFRGENRHNICYISKRHPAPRPMGIVHTMLAGFTEAEHMFMVKQIRRGIDSCTIIKPSLSHHLEDFLGELDGNGLRNIETYIVGMEENKRTSTIESLLTSVGDFFNDVVEQARVGTGIAISNEYTARDCVVSTGLSIGGFVNVPLLATDPRIKYGAVLLAGSLEQTLSYEGDETPLKVVALFRKIQGIPPEVFAKMIADRIPYAPEKYAPGLNPGNVMFVFAKDDDVVPASAARSLIRDSGSPRHDIYYGSHYGVALATTPLINGVLDFLSEKLESAPLCEGKTLDNPVLLEPLTDIHEALTTPLVDLVDDYVDANSR